MHRLALGEGTSPLKGRAQACSLLWGRNARLNTEPPCTGQQQWSTRGHDIQLAAVIGERLGRHCWGMMCVRSEGLIPTRVCVHVHVQTCVLLCASAHRQHLYPTRKAGLRGPKLEAPLVGLVPSLPALGPEAMPLPQLSGWVLASTMVRLCALVNTCSSSELKQKMQRAGHLGVGAQWRCQAEQGLAFCLKAVTVPSPRAQFPCCE